MRLCPRSALLGLVLTLLCPCRAAEPGTLLELGPVEYTPFQPLAAEYQARLQRELPDRAEAFRTHGPGAAFLNLLKDHLTASIPSRKVRYASRDGRGNERVYTGRVFLPSRKAGAAPLEVPLVAYQHATETRRAGVPSNNAGDETLLGALAAELGGFAVAMPDGDGMGGDPSPRMHAYCDAKTTSTCLLDLIRAVKGDLDGARIFDDANYIWDGETYLLGYSEGGYITMAALKELTTNPAYADLKLTGAACMSAPFDFSQSLHELLGDPSTPYSRPYIPAYFVAAWQDLHPEVVQMAEALKPALLARDASGNAAEWLKGELGGNQITPLIQARLTGDPNRQVPARELFNEAWLKAKLDPPGSPLNQLFQANSLVGGWKPESPVLLVHDPYDETVGFSNSRNMAADWVRLGRETEILELGVGGTGPGHTKGAIIAIPTAFMWIGAGMPKSLLAMARDKVLQAIQEAAPVGLEANVEAAATSLGLLDANPNRALLPLSRLAWKGDPGAHPINLSYGDRFFKVGKVKLYTAEAAPLFPGQRPIPGAGGYTRLVKELKDLKDTWVLQPGTTYYMAVYPEKGGVALTLRFQGRDTGTARIRQLKNKLIGRDTPAFVDVSDNFKGQVQVENYDHPERPGAFITLP